MADRDIIQNLIAQLGQSQADRWAAELEPDFARLDERSTDDLLAFTRRLAEHINYFSPAAGDVTPAGDWLPWFADVSGSVATFLEQRKGEVPPHLALFLGFLELYKKPQAIANKFTAAHLDFYYRDVLRLRNRAAVPHRAHLVLELKKGAPPTIIRPDQRFSGGKASDGNERLYAPVGETVINAARVASLRSVYLDPRGSGTVRFAPRADSLDGLGTPLVKDEPKWRGFGYAELPRAEVGFAVASPMLRLAEGTRIVTLRLSLTGVESARLTDERLRGAFGVFLTGPKGWVEPDAAAVTLEAGDVLQVHLTLGATAPAITDYDAAVHGYAYKATAPVVQLLLRSEDEQVGYRDVASVVVQRAQVAVDVSGVTSLRLESDAGSLDPKKAFVPFGPQPSAGSRFMVSYPEALSKKLSELRLAIQWQDAPSSMSTRYAHYFSSSVSNHSFTPAVKFEDGSGQQFLDTNVRLFTSGNASALRELQFTPGAATASTPSSGDVVRALNVAGGSWSPLQAARFVLARPVLAMFLRPPAASREGFVTFTLNGSFHHERFRKKQTENLVRYGRDGGDLVVLNEPYTPTVQSLTLAYRASSADVAVSSSSETDFANPDVQFFHVTPFGPVREHGYLREQFPFVTMKDVPLVPSLPHAGELIIGLEGVQANDSVSLLFQVAEGSADPEVARERLSWSVLSDNHWLRLGPRELTLDTTNDLLTSGIVKVILPASATTENTALPAGSIWLKAAVAENVAAVSQLLTVAANALEVRLIPSGHSSSELGATLPAGTIAKAAPPIAPVKTVQQRYATFAGTVDEGDRAFRARVAERLRHKDRCNAQWDYERVVLEKFRTVHKVKCIPHAKPGSWLAPGHVLLAVVPDLRNRNAVDPLQPRVDADTLSRITAHLQARAGMHVQIAVTNPRYQKIHLDFQVRFHAGFDFNQYREELQRAIVGVLSPWAFDPAPGSDIAFGGVVYRSVLLNFVEERPYVDYVTDFRMYTYAGDVIERADVAAAQPATPDTILVSDHAHTIAAVPEVFAA